MMYGICHLSVVAIRFVADNNSEMTSQLLYGEHFKILENRKKWSKIRVALDGFEGWVTNNQISIIEEALYNEIQTHQNPSCASDLISFIETHDKSLLPIVLGSSISPVTILNASFEGGSIDKKQEKSNLIETALLYINAPFLTGGRTPFGIDCSGFTQMVYKINGHQLKRKALEQSTQGEALSFIEESEPGDLAFFDNTDGTINHVGIIMENNYIIHAHGNIRIDRIDHTGIFNTEKNCYTHQLRVIKKVI